MASAPLRIEDYALIGDCESSALVGRNGSIDWLCWPRFDSGACFAALLGTPENGRWQIAPAADVVTTSRAYRPDTLILETKFETAEGTVRLIDFMPLRDGIELIRLVVCDHGRVAMQTELVLRFGYGVDVPWVTRGEDGSLIAIAGPDSVKLKSEIPLRGEGMKTIGEFVLSQGETATFVLAYGPSYEKPPECSDPREALKATENIWKDWFSSRVEDGPWADALKRSLITLKALTYAPTGGIVAAPTTSLPETIGGIRNWDYRFCWLRDATLTLMALMNSGFYDEAKAWRNWLLRAVAGDTSQVQIMYGMAGERRLSEWSLDWLPGYENSKPVRVGNDAANQIQLDVYGEVIDSFYQGVKGGLDLDASGWSLVRSLLKALDARWQEPDRGIWESRGDPRQYTYSKVMCWVAYDRATKLAEDLDLDGPIAEWRATRDAIHRDVCRNGFAPGLDTFVAWYGSDLLDASLLLIATTGFLPPHDPRIQGTIKAIEKGLVVDGFVLRHDPRLTETGLKFGEGAFIACSFWLADAYALAGRTQDAEALLNRLLAVRNDVGLLAEEFSPALGRQLGNFPQAFSHVGLINTVHNLMRGKKPAEQRSGHGAARPHH